MDSNLAIEELSRLDATIHAQETETRKLKRQRNKLVAIARLPPEVLGRIFLFHRDHMLVTPSSKRTLFWISVTHVSHVWRNVALSCPQLWSIIHLDRMNPFLTSLFFERSKKAPLSIKITEKPVGAEKILIRSLLAEPDRLRSLEVRSGKYEELIQPLSTVAAPLLEKFIYAPASGRASHNTLNVFSGGTPRLRHLELCDRTSPWTSNLFTGLTVIKVKITSRVAFDSPAFIRAMKSCPTLRHLSIRQAHSNLSATSHVETVPLPQLEDLDLLVSIQHCMQLLPCISFPSLKALKLELRSCDFNHGDYAPTVKRLMTLIATSWSAGSATIPVVRALQCLQTRNSLRMETWSEESDTEELIAQPGLEKRPKPTLSLELVSTQVHPQWVSQPLPLLQSLDCKELEYVAINSPLEEFVVEFLSDLQALRSISIWERGARNFCDYLIRNAVRSFPKLVDFTLNSISISTNGGIPLSALVDPLKRRRSLSKMSSDAKMPQKLLKGKTFAHFQDSEVSYRRT
ncbi:hypothetical protein CC1G_09805 [Coprinopsis cinerea okayama7|uniref:Uncharacterized protein n=1 Tax=Coprinopsis cinerea (strain Okayama-7 / 130 / ATCC MYA-4618 / FGSC 9003) TaxID=240176 RepID=A8NMA7_COPC7|nr:hypothetical protein CC1G_09805 [Coprinopsis cinerea okayama7\|eukprot:XP_001834878.2 hypothetical protein CC1G_09805 [Coprinopsis cinerea okayama7\